MLISPLLALMRNQIEAAERMGVRAATINSDNQGEWNEVEATTALQGMAAVRCSPALHPCCCPIVRIEESQSDC